MEMFGFLLIIWSATVIPFLILLGINLVRVWIQGRGDEMNGSSHLGRQRHMTDRPSFITGVVPWLRRSSVSIWRSRWRASKIMGNAQAAGPPAY